LTGRSGGFGKEILGNQFKTSTQAAILDVKELVLVGASYIWCQHREFVKEETTAPPEHPFFFQVLTSNYFGSQANADPK
jgi:hypothetical protein